MTFFNAMNRLREAPNSTHFRLLISFLASSTGPDHDVLNEWSFGVGQTSSMAFPSKIGAF